MPRRSQSRWSIRAQLVASLSIVIMLSTGLFAAFSYQAAERRSLAEIDGQLCAGAEGVRQLVAPIIINQAEAESRDEPAYTEIYRFAQQEIEEYTAAADLEYLYAIVARPDGTAYQLISNLSAEEKARGLDPIEGLLLQPYELSPVMIESARTATQAIDVASDDYGTFRSCLVPVPWTNGSVVLFGADVHLADVEAELRQNLNTNLINGAMVLAAAIAVAVLISTRFSTELRALVAEAEAVSRLDLGDASARRSSTTLEVDLVSMSLEDMRRGLREFSKYVPDAVIRQVLAKGDAVIGGQSREMSILMTDVANFTTISEELMPDQVMVIMSEYFNRVVGALLDEDATVDKYIGDAIFTYWNAPVEMPDHALRCCRAALKAHRASERLAAEWQAKGRMPWRTRFGLHTGPTVFGNVGTTSRLDFTILGASVTVATDLESLNKFYGTGILASGSLRSAVGDAFHFRPVDRAEIDGARDPVEIYELIGSRDDPDFALSAAALAFNQRWSDAVGEFRMRNFRHALAEFQGMVIERPEDHLARLYVKRCAENIARPPPDTWDAVERFEVNISRPITVAT